MTSGQKVLLDSVLAELYDVETNVLLQAVKRNIDRFPEDLIFLLTKQELNNTIWLPQTQMADLFDKDSDTIGLHLKNIFKTKELDEQATTREFSVVRLDNNKFPGWPISHVTGVFRLVEILENFKDE